MHMQLFHALHFANGGYFQNRPNESCCDTLAKLLIEISRDFEAGPPLQTLWERLAEGRISLSKFLIHWQNVARRS